MATKLTDTDQLNGYETAREKGVGPNTPFTDGHAHVMGICHRNIPEHLRDGDNAARAANWVAGYFLGIARNIQDQRKAAA